MYDRLVTAVVAGLSLKNLNPRVWDATSPYYLPDLKAVMVSYAELGTVRSRRNRAMAVGLHEYLGVPTQVPIFLDNGAFNLLKSGGEVCRAEYEAFVEHARPDWYAIPQDYIPIPQMSESEKLRCFAKTMKTNADYSHGAFVPVAHVGSLLPNYLEALQADLRFVDKPSIALGGIVPNLLRAPKAQPYPVIIECLVRARRELRSKKVHVFGIGGTATLHLAALLGMDSVDSSGWRNRAARGIVQLPGTGDRVVANLGSWRGREPSSEEWGLLEECNCPACQQFGWEDITASGSLGFCHRAAHNLWTLLHESQLIADHLDQGNYDDWYLSHVRNSIYLPLIRLALDARCRPSPNV
ncbi:MAG TPA: hypothetical protein VKU87_09080 [Thermomicrobiaceae bacterium]|nr:hypothetical protein [Thermomicrobiaceae bacterium]